LKGLKETGYLNNRPHQLIFNQDLPAGNCIKIFSSDAIKKSLTLLLFILLCVFIIKNTRIQLIKISSRLTQYHLTNDP